MSWVGLHETFGRTNGRVLRVMLGRLIVKNHVEKGLVNMDAAVVIDKAELAKAIHEEADRDRVVPTMLACLLYTSRCV